MSSSSSHQFPFEEYLSHPLPDYENEWNYIIVKLISTTILFLVVIPSILKVIWKNRHDNINNSKVQSKENNNGKDDKAVRTVTSDITTSGKTRKERKSKSQKKKLSQQQKSPDAKNKDDITSNSNDNDTHVEVPSMILAVINVFFLFILFFIIALSPNNIDTARRVYQAPLLTKEECQMIINMANRAAERNAIKAKKELASIPTFLDPNDSSIMVDHEELNEKKEELEKMLKWPTGWKKDRHKNYPTTDLNVVVDFERKDLENISAILNARLSPLFERIYGITKDSIRANDMFVVRYDGDGQQALRKHTDSSHVSFNILLNDEFEGGGTRFHHRLDEDEIYDAKPEPGDVLINNAMVNHEGLPTTKGKG